VEFDELKWVEEVTIFFVVEVFVKFREKRLFNQSEKSEGIDDYWIENYVLRLIRLIRG